MSSQPHNVLSKEIARLKEENAHLRGLVHRYGEFIAALLSLEKTAATVHDSQELLRLLKRILNDALAIVGVQDGSLALLDDETAELEFVIVCGQVAPSLKGYRMPSHEGIAGWVVTHQQPVVVENARLDTRFSQRVDQQTGFYTRSILAVPLVGDDRVLGVVEVINKRQNEPFDDLDQALVWLFCQFAGQALSALDRALPSPGQA
jgi:GAF domain-containing protein